MIRELHKVDLMYQFSLGSFSRLFEKALDAVPRKGGSQAEAQQKERLNQMQKQLTVLTLFYVSRSVFKRDRLTLGMWMCKSIFDSASRVEFAENEWEFFTGTYTGGTNPPGPSLSWVPEDRRPAMDRLRAAFPRIDQAWELTKAEKWTPWLSAEKCEVEFPQTVNLKLSGFQRFLLVQAVRPDRLETAMNRFVCPTPALHNKRVRLTAGENVYTAVGRKTVQKLAAKSAKLLSSEAVCSRLGLQRVAWVGLRGHRREQPLAAAEHDQPPGPRGGRRPGALRHLPGRGPEHGARGLRQECLPPAQRDRERH